MDGEGGNIVIRRFILEEKCRVCQYPARVCQYLAEVKVNFTPRYCILF